MAKRRTTETTRRMQTIIDTINAPEYRDYWPLTVRQVYYHIRTLGQLPVVQGSGKPVKDPYGCLSRLIDEMRIEDLIPWDAIEDSLRGIEQEFVYTSRQEFYNIEKGSFLIGYQRDLMQSQPRHIEVWTEKAALAHVFIRAAKPYRLPVLATRGYSSTSAVNDYWGRLCKAYNDRKQYPLVFYFGDFDPEGMIIPDAAMRKLAKISGVETHEWLVRVALTEEQAKDDYSHCAESLDFGEDIKSESAKKRVQNFKERYNTDTKVEVDAIPPSDLVTMAREAIESALDIEAFEEEKEKEKEDLALLQKARDLTLKRMRGGHGKNLGS